MAYCEIQNTRHASPIELPIYELTKPEWRKDAAHVVFGSFASDARSATPILPPRALRRRPPVDLSPRFMEKLWRHDFPVRHHDYGEFVVECC